MATDVVMPQMGESIAEGHDRPLDQEGRRPDRQGRAALRDLDRQGGRGNSVARRGRAARNHGQGRRDGSGQQRRRGDWRGGGEGGGLRFDGFRGSAAQTPPVPAPRPLRHRRRPPRHPIAARPAPAGPCRTCRPTLADLRRTRSSPLVRKIAKAHGIDIRELNGTGISGRVTKKDILAFVESGGERRSQSGRAGRRARARSRRRRRSSRARTCASRRWASCARRSPSTW